MRRFIVSWLVAFSLTPAFGAQLTGGVNMHGVLPADVAGLTWQACGGLAALTKKWMQGPLFQVIDHSGNTVTIYAKNGYPDVKKLAGLMGISPKVGISGLLSPKVFDQCGGGHDWTQATTANQPAIWLVNGNVYIFMGGILSTNAQNLLQAQYYAFASGAVTSSTQSASIFAVVNPYTTSDAVLGTSGFPAIINSDGSYLWAPGIGFLGTPSAGNLDFNTFGGPTIGGTNLTIQQSVLNWIMSASASSVSINEATVSAAAQSLITGHYNYWGFTSGAPVPSGFSGRQMALMVNASALTTPQAQQVRAALYKWANVKTIPSAGFTNLVIDGASIDEGQGGDASGLYGTQNGGGYGWGEMIKDYLQQRGYAIQINNAAVSGATLQSTGVAYAASTNTLYNSSARKNVYFGFNSAIGNTLGYAISGAFTAAISGTVMTVTGTPAIPLQVAQNITVPGGTNTTITSFGTGSGGAGTYNIANSQTVASESMTATSNGTSAYNDFLAALAKVKAQSWDVIVTYLFNTTDPQTLVYNNLMIANATANGIKIIQLQPSNNTSHNFDQHPTIVGYQGYYGNIIGQILPMVLNFVLSRDIDPTSNDNEPMWLEKAA